MQANAGIGQTEAVKPWYAYAAIGAVAGGLTGVIFPDPFTRFFDYRKDEAFDRLSVTLAGVGAGVGVLLWLKNRGASA
jgi:hypothetical protein